jgi:transcriptional regulator
VLTKRELEILELRTKGLTQVEIAEKLNISQAAISGFERSAHKKIKEAQSTLAEANRLGVNLDERN